jgi:hypothetical protein
MHDNGIIASTTSSMPSTICSMTIRSESTRSIVDLLAELEDYVRQTEQTAASVDRDADRSKRKWSISNENDAFLVENVGLMFRLLCSIRSNSLGEPISELQMDAVCRFVDAAIANGVTSLPSAGTFAADAEPAASAPTDGRVFLGRRGNGEWLPYRRTPDGVFRHPTGPAAYSAPDEWRPAQ